MRAALRAPAPGPDLFPEDLPRVHVGETWAKKLKDGTRLYLVLEADAAGHLTLQNIAVPSSVFQSSADKMLASGYFLVSQTPYVDLARARRSKNVLAPKRCPHTLDIFEGRADREPPVLGGSVEDVSAAETPPDQPAAR
ncbi:MAG TPA: hypothetical protein VFP70_05630 [Burkholderiales bacterium]|nr:hypothetical protein [Burkholderiales bacterium]